MNADPMRTPVRPMLPVAASAIAIAAALALPPVPAAAQSYPARPVRLIVPFAPGAASDITGRLVAHKLGEGFNQSFVVDNRPGAGGNIGHDMAAKAPPDGYTIVLANESLAINASLSRKLPFDTLRDLAAISLVTINPRVFVASVASPFESIKDVVAASRAKPNSIRYGSSGIGSGPHLAGAMLSNLAKIEMIHVPYKGAAPALADVLGGQIEMIATTILSSQPMIQSGKLRALAVTSAKRSGILPNVPTVAESGVPGFEATSWLMLLGPAKMPRAVVARLHEETARFIEQSDVRKRVAADGGEPVGSSPEQAAAYLKGQVDRWGQVIRAAGVQPES
ncbi:MAG: tripartite tricarboxylate transporter substrate binding protein [Rhodocyclaceae bacterium]|nr:tripartite tricarboxylate transporter substrate binding protein [Rhodocyclaceae bacterium]